MAYPNFSNATSAQVFPTPTNGSNCPGVVTLTGTGVSQVIIRKADGATGPGGPTGNVNTEQLDGQVTGAANRGVQYVVPIAKNGTVQLTAGLKDAQGVTASAPNTFTFRSWNTAVLSPASFVPPTGANWLPSQIAPVVPAGQSGPGGGNGLVWNPNVVNVNASGLVTAGTGPAGYGIVEVRYPLDNAGVNSNNFIAALLKVTVTAAGVDVE